MNYARTRPDRIAAVAFMEAMAPPFMPLSDINVLPPELVQFMTGIRTKGVGEQMVPEQNVFLDCFMRHDGAGLSEEVMAEYNRPFPTPESRQIVLDWSREIPMGRSPADVHKIVQENSDFVAASTFPKLMFHVSPGAVKGKRFSPVVAGKLVLVGTKKGWPIQIGKASENGYPHKPR